MTWSDRIGRRLKLQDLHVLIATIEAGTMGRAARKLNSSQPAVSRSITDLERALGVPLLDRSPRGVVPTKYGSALANCAVAAFDDLRQGVKDIEFLKDPSFGEVRLGGLEPIVAGIVPTIFRRMRRRYPKVSINVVQASTLVEQMQALRERRVDLILSRLTSTVDDDISTELLFNDPSFVVAGVTNRWARRRKLSLSDLAGEPWALPAPTTLVGAIFEEAFRRRGIAYPSQNAAFGHVHLHVSLVASGQFLAILPGSLLRFGADRLALKILPVESPVPSWPVGVLTLKQRTLSPLVSFFIDCGREVAAIFARNN